MRAVAAACRERLTVLRIDLDRLSQRQIGWLVFLATLCVYVFLTPHVVRNWWLTGDEPHYLLAAHSIVHDGDLKLANNYEQKDSLAFFVGGDLNPSLQAAPGADGDFTVETAYQPFVLYFHSAGERDFEFRVRSTGASAVLVDPYRTWKSIQRLGARG